MGDESPRATQSTQPDESTTPDRTNNPATERKPILVEEGERVTYDLENRRAAQPRAGESLCLRHTAFRERWDPVNHLVAGGVYLDDGRDEPS